MAITGLSIIGRTAASAGSSPFSVHSRLNGDLLEPVFETATRADLDTALELASEAAPSYGVTWPSERATFLETIADRLEANREEIVARANQETGLPPARLNGELTRTCGQFRFFAEGVRKGVHLDIRIDLANPDRTPSPMPEIRSMQRPLGPVAVFGAANFPLAFSVAGGDTASALAAGCPVIAKSHPSHPGTCELTGACIRDAVEACGLPEGVFSMLHLSHETAGELVAHPDVAAAGFTGSRSAGMKLLHLAASRHRPIPFYAEMSSLNPVVVLPEALLRRGSDIAKGLAASLTLGVGQFCTNPGLVFAVGESEDFLHHLQLTLDQSAPGLMLNTGIEETYLERCHAVASVPGVTSVLAPTSAGSPGLFVVDLATFISNRELHEEVFGPTTLVVRCKDVQEALAGLKSLEGQLTATLHLEEGEYESAGHLFAQMERIAGRLVVNAFPTGVEVCEAMVHGGPFPATSDGRSTSVGGRAVLRWMRAVCYQDVPEELLPPELRPPPYS